jgi:hypothetical protein
VQRFSSSTISGVTSGTSIAVNDAMLRNTLDVLGRTTALDHATLVTGLKHYLGPFESYRSTDLASWWHTDADLGREVETFADMSKSRLLGFLDYQPSVNSFLDLFEALRAARIIPRVS